MSAATSPSTGKRYGALRVCSAWDVPRSSYYSRRSAPGNSKQTDANKKRRGPRPLVSDERLLELIRSDLAVSPFHGEGHRKVWARLRVIRGVRVARKRVLRIMRQKQLLSPHRGRRGEGVKHDGTIITASPNVMWGTDGARVFTVDDGWVWIFSAVEHWNAECVGWHVCKTGDRYAALQPVAMGISRIYGSASAGAARGLLLRMDHGTQYLSDHFLNQLRFWGVAPSFAFIEEPETNGVAERFNRTLKEQAVFGRTFRTVEDVRAAVGAFVEQYNKFWLVEKLGFKSPADARQDHSLKVAA